MLDLFRAALGIAGERGARIETADRQPMLPGERRGGLSTQMQRLLKMANKEFTESARILEINPSAPLDPPALQSERQRSAPRLHQAVRACSSGATR